MSITLMEMIGKRRSKQENIMNDKIIQGWRAKVERDRLAKEEADKATSKPRIHVVTKRPKLDKK